MSRFRIAALLAVIASLALAATASATRIAGGTTTIALSDAASQVLITNHLTVTPIAPATASGSTFTFPIAGGRLNAKDRGFITHRGGITISNGTKSISIRRLTIFSTRKGISVYGLLPVHRATLCVAPTAHRLRHCRLVVVARVVRVATVTGAAVSNGTATGTVRLTAVSAAEINRLAGKSVVSAGAPLGTVTVTPAVTGSSVSPN